jgi:type VI secretion system protein ImpA
MALELKEGDLEAILAPIPGDRPSGVDVREDSKPTSVYFRLRDARSDARDAERQADGLDSSGEDGAGNGTLQSRWRPVATLATTALKESTKDLEIATWLTEALVRISGLEGLTAGATVIGGMVERYWEDLFPMPDDAGMEARLAAVGGLSGQGVDGTLMQPLRKSLLFMRPDGTPFTLWQYELTEEVAQIGDPARREQRLAAGVVPFEEFEKEGRSVGPAHWSALRKTVNTAITAWETMGRLLDEKAGSDSPSGSNVRTALQKMLETCNRFAPADDAENGTAEGEQARAAAGVAGAPSGAIGGREQALRQLQVLAEWFKRNEPNSPIGYTLDEAARRARMAWPDLVAELITDEGSRSALIVSIGMKRPDAPQG